MRMHSFFEGCASVKDYLQLFQFLFCQGVSGHVNLALSPVIAAAFISGGNVGSSVGAVIDRVPLC